MRNEVAETTVNKLTHVHSDSRVRAVPAVPIGEPSWNQAMEARDSPVWKRLSSHSR